MGASVKYAQIADKHKSLIFKIKIVQSKNCVN